MSLVNLTLFKVPSAVVDRVLYVLTIHFEDVTVIKGIIGKGAHPSAAGLPEHPPFACPIILHFTTHLREESGSFRVPDSAKNSV